MKLRLSLLLPVVVSTLVIGLVGLVLFNQNRASAAPISNKTFWTATDKGGYEICANCAVDESVRTWSDSYTSPILQSVVQIGGMSCFLSTFGSFGDYTNSGWWYLDLQSQNLSDEACSPALSIGFTNGT